MAIDNVQFKQGIEALTGRRMKKQKMARPTNPQKKKVNWGVGIKLTLSPVLTPVLQLSAPLLVQLGLSLAVICWVRFSAQHYKHSELPLLVC